MKATKIISACAVLVALASCSNDHVISQPGAEDMLTHMSVVSSVGGPKTKAANTAADVQDTQFANNEVINVYLFEKTTGTKIKDYGKNSDGLIPMKADGAGKLTTDDAADNATLFYPTNGNPVNAYAYYPALSESGYNIKESGTSSDFTVVSDQSDKADYRKSDLMCATKTENAKKDDPVDLTFTHKLSKIEVILKADATSGVNTSQLTDATVKIKNVLPTIELSSISEGTITLGNAKGSVQDITIGKNGITPDATYGYAGIIVPQDITGEKELFNVTLKEGGSYTYKVSNGTTINFVSGNRYTYTLKLTSGGLTVESTAITPWTQVNNGENNATLD